MSIGNVSSAGMNPYPCTSSRRKAAGKGNFSADMQKTAKEKETAKKSPDFHKSRTPRFHHCVPG